MNLIRVLILSVLIIGIGWPQQSRAEPIAAIIFGAAIAGFVALIISGDSDDDSGQMDEIQGSIDQQAKELQQWAKELQQCNKNLNNMDERNRQLNQKNDLLTGLGLAATFLGLALSVRREIGIFLSRRKNKAAVRKPRS